MAFGRDNVPERRLAPVTRPVDYTPLCHQHMEGSQMKQKYAISRNDDNVSVTITEYSEVDKDIYAQLCTETFLIADLPDPGDNPDGVIQAFRTRNMFPPSDYAFRIADSLAQLLADDTQRIIEVKIDDKAEITQRREAAEKLAEEEMEQGLAEDELDAILDAGSAKKKNPETETADK
jgi:hypothetical protein